MSKKTPSVSFLLDVHTEPFPARFVPPALEQLKSGVEKALAGRLEHGAVTVSGTLRHLILRVDGVGAKGSDKTERFKGPKEGAPMPAVEGFARKYGKTPPQLVLDGGIYYAEVHTKGEPAAAIFAALVPELLKSLQFPKVMTWEATNLKFGRPLRAITAVLGDKVIPVSLGGVKSGKLVYGHPVLAKKPAVLKDIDKHAAILRQGLVIADPGERKEYLAKSLAQAAKSTGGQAEPDDALLDETNFMVEHPVPVLGRLRDEHMKLPHELLKLVMKKQLKFFPVVSSSGELRPFFIGVRDGLSSGNELVREGYQRVLEARFNDAGFFVGRDEASKLETKLPLLERVTYQKALGTMAQKAARVADIASYLAGKLRQTSPVDEQALARAAKLAYADLVTDVVKEFPELQGHMGGVYARKDGESEKVALAVEQFYHPVAAKSPIPATPEGAVLSLAGKLDGLAGCFAAGLIPSGSADPFALRRQALGAIRIILEKQLPVDLEDALKHALSLQPVKPQDPAKLEAQLLDFVWGRAQNFFEDMKYAVDEVRSIRNGALKDLPNAFRRLAALKAVRRDPAFEPLAAAFKRASNILKQSKGDGAAVERSLLKEAAELGLYDALVEAEGAANDRIVRGDFEGGLKSLVGVKPHLDKFFDGVMVMVDDESLKNQRLALLSKLVRAFRRVADLSEIQAPAA